MTFQKSVNYHGKQVITAEEDTSFGTTEERELKEPMKWIVETGRKIESTQAPVLQDRNGLPRASWHYKNTFHSCGKAYLPEDVLHHDIISVPSVELYLTPPEELYRSIWAARFICRSHHFCFFWCCYIS